MTNGNLRVGLIGAGGVARTRAHSLSVLDGVEITAVADVSADREGRAGQARRTSLSDVRRLAPDAADSQPFHSQHETEVITRYLHHYASSDIDLHLEGDIFAFPQT